VKARSKFITMFASITEKFPLFRCVHVRPNDPFYLSFSLIHRSQLYLQQSFWKHQELTALV